MVTYAITEELVAAAAGTQLNDDVVEESIEYTGIYRQALYDIGAAVAKANGCKVLISNWKKNTTILHVIGFKTDVTKVHMLDASLQIQAATARGRWEREGGVNSAWSGMTKFKSRRQFYYGFAQGLASKLDAAKRAGRDEAVTTYAAETGQTEAVVSTSTDLVLRTRTERVQDWYDETYGGRTRNVSRRYSAGAASAGDAGRAAGRSANVGQAGLGHTRAIGGS
jgi:hypothetical protein